MIVDIPEFKLMQELKIYKMEAEISLVCLTFKEIKDLWNRENMEVCFHGNLA